MLVAAQPFGFFVFAYGRYPVWSGPGAPRSSPGLETVMGYNDNDNDPDPS
ncbi:hypothetical protein ACVH9Z_31220 [Rhodococcus opacus]